MEFYGLFGKTLGHSLSPQLHQLIYRKLGLEAAYKNFAFPPEELKAAFEGVRALSISGVNVTIPYKEAVNSYLDELDSFAERVQAVNTIKNQNGKLVGYNTDYSGFGLIFERRNWELKDKTAVLLGTGGSAKIVETYLLDHGVKQLHIISRTPERFESTEKKSYTNYEKAKLLSADYLINTTPVGMYPKGDASPLEESSIQKYDRLIDLIYNPFETKLLALGRKNNKQTANGLDMLVGQAVRSVEIWQNDSIDSKLTDELIEELMEQMGERL